MSTSSPPPQTLDSLPPRGRPRRDGRGRHVARGAAHCVPPLVRAGRPGANLKSGSTPRCQSTE